MKINYIILAHKNPIQLKRLVERLSGPGCFFYIHIDRKADIHQFKKELKNTEVYFMPQCKREVLQWGDINIVTATLHILQQIMADQRTGFCVLLSGQDYPLKNNAYIKTFFSNHAGKDFINHFQLPSAKWPKNGKDRLTHYKINFSNKRGDFLLYPSIFSKDFYTKENIRNLKKLLRSSQWSSLSYILNPRSFPNYIKAFGGSQWWAINTETAKRIIEFIAAHPDYLIYHKHTFIPDEIFFHSIIMDTHKNSPELVCETITYVDWLRPNVLLPVTFTFEDFQELKNLPYEALFARKFDLEIDEKILDQIDTNLL